MNECIFCLITAHQTPANIVYEDDMCLAFLDKFPQTRGHMQLIPKKHYRWIWDVPDMGALFSIAQKIIKTSIPALGASHVTIGTFGREIEHAHIWIVPQYGRNLQAAEGRGRGKSDGDKEETAALLRGVLAH